MPELDSFFLQSAFRDQFALCLEPFAVRLMLITTAMPSSTNSHIPCLAMDRLTVSTKHPGKEGDGVEFLRFFIDLLCYSGGMPRKARIDAPGALQHIICRGIERRKVFNDDADKNNFVARLGRVLSESQTPCYAWALIDNHFHLLLKTGNVPIATVMRRLLTGYAVSFNLRHKRSGRLFQNRYKSILCQEDAYLLELAR